MNKVITINLNGRAYQLEEDGYAALSSYLDDAKARLAEDPGKAEIIADLEQAIAEKCDKTLSPHKNVVATDDIKKIIAEMGPVEGNGTASGDERSDTHSSEHSGPAPKRLYRIEEGKMIWGVANGLAAFFGIDVTLIRIIFVILTLITGGGFAFAYFAMMILIPEADTMQEKAAAHGEPFNAQELVNRAKLEYARITAQFTDSHGNHKEWHKWKHEMKKARKQWKYGPGPQDIHPHHTNHLLGLLRSVIAIAWVLGLLSLITTGALFGWAIPAGIPLWLAIILLFVLYHAVTGPMRAHQNPHSWDRNRGYSYHYSYNEWDGIGDGLSILFIAVAFGWAYLHVPQVYSFVHHPIAGTKEAIALISNWIHSL